GTLPRLERWGSWIRAYSRRPSSAPHNKTLYLSVQFGQSVMPCQSVAHVFRLPFAGCAILSRERDKKVVGDTLERDLRAIYGAYEYLRAHDLAAVSTTSRLLHECDLAYLARRARDEMEELRGAVAGTHGHGGGRADI